MVTTYNCTQAFERLKAALYTDISDIGGNRALATREGWDLQHHHGTGMVYNKIQV